MELQAALDLSENKGFHLVLDRFNVEHHENVVGTVLALAVLKQLGSTTFDEVCYEYAVEANSELNSERFSLSGDVLVDLSGYADLAVLKHSIAFLVLFDLIGQAVSIGQASSELTKAYESWDLKSVPFEFECSEGFNIVDIANEVAEAICKSIEKFYGLKTEKQALI